MTFNTKKLDARRFSFELFEIDLDINDPALDATFALQADSYGTPKTTDNILAYTGVDFKTYRYADQQLFGVDHFPNLERIKSNPPKIDPGKSLGFRASGSVMIKDFNDGDQYSLNSNYADRRVYGSHFKKLFANNHLKNRRARRVRGYDPMNYDASNCQIENYLIDSYTYPNQMGMVTFSLVDELILVETKQAKAPAVSKGELSVILLIGDTSLTFSSSITDEYGAVSATGYIAIEKEIMSYTVTSSTTMDISRAKFGTEAKEHDVRETIQKVIIYDNENIIDIITDLITNYTKIPASYIPTADWAALKTGDLAGYNLTNQIYKPTDIEKLLNDLIMLAGLSMYVDIINQKLVIVTVPDFSTPIITFDEDEHIIQGSMRVKRAPKDQITRQTIHWDKAEATESDREENFTKHFQVIDTTVEVDADEGVVSENKPLISRWLINSLDNNLLATSFAQRNINRFSKVPIQANFRVDQRYIDEVAGGMMCLGSIFNLNSSEIVDGGLNPIETTFQCISIKQSNKNQEWDIAGLSYVAAAPPSADLYISEDKTDYLLTDELVTDEAREYTVVVGTGVTIGASSTAAKSFTQGSFFAGATLKIINLGRIVGPGGDGGDGGEASGMPGSCSTSPATNGLPAGDSLSLSTDTVIDNGFGLIGGGGGGGAGDDATCFFDGEFGIWIGTNGNGGGGGQGQIGGTPSGTIAAPGRNGGALGQPGGDETTATGGSAGNAILKNGNTVTIIAGNNSEQIKGAVI